MMNLYDTLELEMQFEQLAENNDGEISEHAFQELIEAQTASLIQVEKLCKYIRHLETFIDTCKEEENRIRDKRQIAENRIDSIKKYLLPYVDKHDKIETGTFKLSTRKSTAVKYNEYFDDARFMTVVHEIKVNKNDLKKALKDGEDIQGAWLVYNKSIQIK